LAKIQVFLSLQFTVNQDEWATDAVVEQRIRVNATRVRVCNVAVLRAETPLEEVKATPPLICIEVMSPEDRIPRAMRVLADYLAMGVPNIWLIDPYKRVAYTYDAGGLHPADTTALTVPGTPIRLDLSAAFAQLDKKAAARPRG
jgi:Uma2 family endonuclease